MHDVCADKAKKLNAGRIITPDATLSKIFPKKIDMLQMAKVRLSLPIAVFFPTCVLIGKLWVVARP